MLYMIWGCIEGLYIFIVQNWYLCALIRKDELPTLLLHALRLQQEQLSDQESMDEKVVD